MVAHDNWASLPSAIKAWDYALNPIQGTPVTHTTNWSAAMANHISHTNAKPTSQAPLQQQYACGGCAYECGVSMPGCTGC